MKIRIQRSKVRAKARKPGFTKVGGPMSSKKGDKGYTRPQGGYDAADEWGCLEDFIPPMEEGEDE